MRRFFIFALFVILALGGVAAWLWYSLHTPFGNFQPPGVFVDIPKGASERSISHLLAQQGVISNEWAFDALCRYRSRRALEAGEYYFDHPQTAFAVFDTIAAGRVYQISVTVPEGFNTFQIADLLESKGLTTRDAFLAAAADPTPIRDLDSDVPTVEGFLFPATYQFPRHVTAQQIIAKMTDHFRTEWNSLLAGETFTGTRSPKYFVTLASLVESETPKFDERPIIAGVFLNRLHRGMALGCDPTVVYALEKTGLYKGTVTLPDLRVDSPYNTYRYPGLPPGPITNPGETSLRAALHPASVDFFYFVADTEGGHLFAKTLTEHNSNVARYHKLLKQKSHKEPAPSR
jgi:UPF0755 protein